MKPGDFVVIHTTGLSARAIQILTLSHWNHSALLAEELPDGDWIIHEATPRRGYLIDSRLSQYSDWIPSTFPLSDVQRVDAVDLSTELEGRHYGIANIEALALDDLGVRIGPVLDRADNIKTPFCSMTEAWIYEQIGFPIPNTNEHVGLVTPAALARAIQEAA